MATAGEALQSALRGGSDDGAAGDSRQEEFQASLEMTGQQKRTCAMGSDLQFVCDARNDVLAAPFLRVLIRGEGWSLATLRVRTVRDP